MDSIPAPAAPSRHWRATQMLLVATLFWGVSFPVGKALLETQQKLLPGLSPWFFSALCLTYRFALAALIFGACLGRSLAGLTRRELGQGISLALFGAGGLLFQMDGLARIPASTSAFLTQLYCIMIPAWLAIRRRRWPSATTLACCLLVLAGAAVLSGFDWQALRLGRGEAETILGSALFCGQILLLEHPAFAQNHMGRTTVAMFAATSLACLPVAVLTATRASDWWRAYASPACLAFLAILILLCTLISYVLMNYWQARVSATEAGLIYATEPVFASCFALFLPARLSSWAGIHYPNEQLTWCLLVGGGLIVAANAWLQVQNASQAKS